MKYIVAVSGGVDSVVLLDLMRKTKHTIVVAHVDHGIREDSGADARFVQALAEKYGLPFVSTELKLGVNASEERARNARYDFLREKAAELGAIIMTAHHQGDVIETVALNLTRGTGWRGLAVMNGKRVVRPLLHIPKRQLIEYAVTHRLEWVEDATNETNAYLRNRLRKKISRMVDKEITTKIMTLRSTQLILRKSIAEELERLVPFASSRHFLSQVDADVAEELLAAYIYLKAGISVTRPSRARALLAVKTARPRTVHHVMSGIELHFTSRNLSVKVV